MSIRNLALAWALGGALACSGGGGGGGGGEACPGSEDELVGACREADGSCREYRGAIDEQEARDDCAGADESTFVALPCPEAARLRGTCSGTPRWNEEATGTVVQFEPRAEGYEFKLYCVELGACYDPTGRDDDACYGTTDVLVGSCRYASGRCMEFRGAFDEAAARDECGRDPPGEFQGAECPAATRASGSCSGPEHGGTLVLYHQELTPEELAQLCGQDEDEACYQAP